MWRSIWRWHLRRRRFSEEWEFHRELLSTELRAAGLNSKEVRQAVKRRLGPRSRWRRDALREIDGSWRDFLNALDLSGLAASCWFLPAMLALAIVLLLICDPFRARLLSSLVTQPREQVPLRRIVIVPADFARFTWSLLLCFEFMWLNDHRRSWRMAAYAVLVFVLLAAFGVAVWVAGIQLWIAIAWPSDMLQGVCILDFLFAYAGGCLLAAKWWRRDVSARCPVCLRRARAPIVRGQRHDLLLNPLEVESLCPAGHGVFTENYWNRAFRQSPEFWEDLAARR